eukprot:TRINITY_DN16307_c0_g1_i1.p1 TRINITY_DN16307_c0_g1~~TRINITY_DN16307_c0_g1_i1.p1  ORF type:complete len:496 (+),score=41.26 TRINITY_DN16307_c0_g1_i1:524-2011(+)
MTKKFVCADEGGNVKPSQSLLAWQLVGLLFVATVGGAYGVEGCVREGGGWGTLVGVLITPWVWGLPTAVVVAELATAVPSNAGAVMWVNLSSPEWVTLSFVIISGIANFVDNSLYPNLLASYLLPPTSTIAPHILVKATTLAVSTLVNVYGIDVVAHFGSVFTILITLPFLLIFLLYLPSVSLTNIYNHVPTERISWSRFLPLLSWNMSGFDSAGHIVEEVQSPGRTLFKSFVWLIILTEVVYILPIIAAVGTGKHPPESWAAGYWVIVAEDAGGAWMEGLMKMGGVVSCFGFMTAVICTTSRAIQGIAVLGVFPESVSGPLRQLHPVYKTPVNAIIFNSLVTGILSLSMEFSLLVDVGQMLYSTRLLLVFYSAVYLRYRYPDLKRPFKVPFSTPGLLLATSIPSLYSLILLLVSVTDSPDSTAVFCLLATFILLLSITTKYFCSTKAFEGRIVDDEDDGADEEIGRTSLSPHQQQDPLPPMRRQRDRSMNPTVS